MLASLSNTIGPFTLDIQNHPDLLSEAEKASLQLEYRKWLARPRVVEKDHACFFAPLNMREDALIEGTRYIHNSFLRFVPIVFIWPIAEFASTLGKIIKDDKTEAWGRKILNILQNFKSVSR